MAFLVNAVTATAKAVDNTVKSTSSTIAKTVYATQQPEEKKQYNTINPDSLLLNRKNAKLMFRFHSNNAHWEAFVYEKGRMKCTKCHYTMGGVNVYASYVSDQEKGDWKEYPIKFRSYRDVINFCKGYSEENPSYSLIQANCRKFVIRLAEYCNIPTTEIHWVISSQYYSTADVVKDTIDGTEDITKGNVISGVGGIGSSIVKNSAKIIVSTGNQVINTSKSVVDSTVDSTVSFTGNNYDQNKQ
eukprot:315797_1